MLKRIAFIVSIVALAAAPVFAQDPKAEVGITGGWTFTNHITTANAIVVPGVGTFNQVGPKDSFIFGIDVGFFIGPNAEVGFLYGQEPSKLQVSGTTTVDVGDMSIHTYHGYFAYNWGHGDAMMRPYILGGLGATSFGDINYQTVNRSGTISGPSRFSTTWGAGVKIYGNKNVGGRFGFRWTPTYIQSNASGWWCDPYWGCYLVGNAQYVNQFDINGGVTFRF
jgi:hypothetical protein